LALVAGHLGIDRPLRVRGLGLLRDRHAPRVAALGGVTLLGLPGGVADVGVVRTGLVVHRVLLEGPCRHHRLTRPGYPSVRPCTPRHARATAFTAAPAPPPRADRPGGASGA